MYTSILLSSALLAIDSPSIGDADPLRTVLTVTPSLTYGFTPITISQLEFTPGHITTASMSFGVPLQETESEYSLSMFEDKKVVLLVLIGAVCN